MQMQKGEKMAKIPEDTIYHYEQTDKKTITITQIPLIRCKDCEYWWNKCLCKIFSKYGSIKTYEDDFCSYGERREDAEIH